LAINDPPPAAGPSWLQRGNRLIARLEDGLLILLLVAMIALAATQIALRDIWESGLEWGDPITKVLVLWVTMLGAIAATRDGNHINIDLLSRFLPIKAQSVNRMITDLFAALVCAVLAYHAARMVIIDHEAATQAFAAVPTWLCEIIIPIGFAVMGLRFLSASLLAIYQKLHPRP
jgi:TRAP-type C4-dicarboxylate transport system permease small subunit